jgi:NTP pyrophosphatase (non-canonical NTP hydrolase)
MKETILKDEFNPIRDWAKSKGIYHSGDIKTQYVKLQEEAGELAKAIIKNDSAEINDAIGDIVIVLTSIAYFNNVKIEDCINNAYNIVSKRTGRMLNGSFVKDGNNL